MAVPRVSEEFWDDADWAKEHYGELQKRYRNVWIAIAGKKVVSYGKNLKEVEAEAEKRVGRKDILTIYVESGAAVY
mgnify:CR=1 FL=1